MSELPALEAALADAARRRHPPRRRSTALRHGARRLVPAVVAFAVVALAAGALLALARRDDPEREARPPKPVVGVPGYDSRTPVSREPSLRWGVRVDRNAAGLPCPAVGQIAAGALTREVSGHRRRVPRSTNCVPPPVHAAVFAFEWRVADHRQLLIVFGLASRDVRELRLTTPAGTQTLRPGPKGSFIAVYDDEPRSIERELVFEDGSTHRLPKVDESALPTDG